MVLTALGCAAKMRAMLQTSSSGCAPVVAAKTWTCSANKERQTAMRYCRRYCSKPSLARLRDSVWAEVEHTTRLEPKGRETEYATRARWSQKGRDKGTDKCNGECTNVQADTRPPRGHAERRVHRAGGRRVIHRIIGAPPPPTIAAGRLIHHRCPRSTGARRRNTSPTG